MKFLRWGYTAWPSLPRHIVESHARNHAYCLYNIYYSHYSCMSQDRRTTMELNTGMKYTAVWTRSILIYPVTAASSERLLMCMDQKHQGRGPGAGISSLLTIASQVSPLESERWVVIGGGFSCVMIADRQQHRRGKKERREQQGRRGIITGTPPLPLVWITDNSHQRKRDTNNACSYGIDGGKRLSATLNTQLQIKPVYSCFVWYKTSPFSVLLVDIMLFWQIFQAGVWARRISKGGRATDAASFIKAGHGRHDWFYARISGEEHLTRAAVFCTLTNTFVLCVVYTKYVRSIFLCIYLNPNFLYTMIQVVLHLLI